MHTFDDRIGLEQQQPVIQASIQHRAIIARPHDNRGVSGQRVRQLLDQFKFSHATHVRIAG